MCLLVGDRKAADEYAKPLKAGRIRFCPDTPQLYWLAYLENALDQGKPLYKNHKFSFDPTCQKSIPAEKLIFLFKNLLETDD